MKPILPLRDLLVVRVVLDSNCPDWQHHRHSHDIMELFPNVRLRMWVQPEKWSEEHTHLLQLSREELNDPGLWHLAGIDRNSVSEVPPCVKVQPLRYPRLKHRVDIETSSGTITLDWTKIKDWVWAYGNYCPLLTAHVPYDYPFVYRSRSHPGVLENEGIFDQRQL